MAQFEVEPSTIERGQAATLRWNVSGETSDVSISSGIGTVSRQGNRQVYPSSTTTYTLTATGAGGEATMTATVNVTSPAPPPPSQPTTTSKRSASDILAQDVKDIYFDYDSSSVREDARAILTRNGDAIKQLIAEYPSAKIVVEGHADERGSAEYNLGLSDRRATTAKEFLVQLGVPADRLSPVSYGRERPQCTEANETCLAIEPPRTFLDWPVAR
ncbi:MAG: OmpA family protein [Bryobacteraceae bacterium]